MTDQPFGVRFFHSENELKADRLNKLELCRFNILQSVLQKEKALFEKTFKQRYEQTLRSPAFRRLSDSPTHLITDRRPFLQGRFLQRRYSADTPRGSLRHQPNPGVRKRPMTHNSGRDARPGNDGNCVVCERIANGIRGFKSEENSQPLKALDSHTSPDHEHVSIISRRGNQENGEQLSDGLDDCFDLCRLFSVNSSGRESSTHNQAGSRESDSTNIANGELNESGEASNSEKHQVHNVLDKQLLESFEPAGEVSAKQLSDDPTPNLPHFSNTATNNTSSWSSKKRKSRNHKHGYISQKVYQSEVSFNKVSNKISEINANVNNNGHVSEAEQNCHGMVGEVTVESKDSVCGAEQNQRQKLCHCRDEAGLRMKVDRFLKHQDEYNKRNPLSKEISAQSEIIRLKSSTCERRRKVEQDIAGSKDVVINEVLTALRLKEERPSSPESLPPIIL